MHSDSGEERSHADHQRVYRARTFQIVQLLRLFKTIKPAEAIAVGNLNFVEKVKIGPNSKRRIQPRCRGSTVQMFKSQSNTGLFEPTSTAHMGSGRG
jgi:hypothetical protein